MRLSDLTGRRLVLWGAGRETGAVLRAARRLDIRLDVAVIDDHEGTAELEGHAVLHGEAARGALEKADVVVRSPGISRYRPDVRALVQRGVDVTTATNLWFGEGLPSIAVTGTKGKSTTSSLIAHLLRSVGRQVELAGNIGRAPLDLLGDHTPDLWVLELSSFQTADVDTSPSVGVLTTLSPEHLDWHGDYDHYRADKLNLFAHDPDMTVVANAADAGVREVLDRLPRRTIRVGADGGVRIEDDYFVAGGRRLAPVDDLQLVGDHNLQLACMAMTAVGAAGIDLEGHRDDLSAGLRTFEPLAHRLAPVAEYHGVTYIDDGLATTPIATMAAIDAFADRPTTVLLGGYDRGVSYDGLGRHIVARRDIHVVTMPDNGHRIAEAIRDAGGGIDLTESSGLADAVRIAAEVTPGGGVVLLSPAAASFGHFRDYEERSAAFIRAVHALLNRTDG